jgi:hypothetical protein
MMTIANIGARGDPRMAARRLGLERDVIRIGSRALERGGRLVAVAATGEFGVADGAVVLAPAFVTVDLAEAQLAVETTSLPLLRVRAAASPDLPNSAQLR